MRSAKSTGRIVGLLLLAQFLGLMFGFILLVPITKPEFLQTTAAIASQIRLAVLFLFAAGAVTIGIAIYAFPFFREHSPRMALWLVALSIIWFSLQAVDNQHILSMMSLSQQYAEGTVSAEVAQAAATAVRSTRRWAHYTELLVMDVWFFLLYATLFRFAIVPRVLAGFALALVAIHVAAVPLPAFIGYRQLMVLAYSLLLSYALMCGWLLAKGFANSGLNASRVV